MAQNKPSQGRITYFDWLRGMATAAVVVLHMLNKPLTEYPLGRLGVPLVLTWTELQLVFTRWAVPVFLMVTGALLLNSARKPDWHKTFRYVGRAAAALALFCPIYACVSARAVTPTAILTGLGQALTEGSWDHLWYLYALMGLYLLTPLLWFFVRDAPPALQRTTLCVLAVPTLVVPSINSALGVQVTTLVWVTSSLFYYLLGAYAHRHLRLDGRIRLAGLGSLAACSLAIAAVVAGRHASAAWLIRPACPLVAPWSLYLFLAAKKRFEGTQPPPWLALLSDHSLAIYLIHPIFIVVIYRRLWWVPYETLPPVIFELAVLAILFGATIPLALLLRRIPGLNRVL